MIGSDMAIGSAPTVVLDLVHSYRQEEARLTSHAAESTETLHVGSGQDTGSAGNSANALAAGDASGSRGDISRSSSHGGRSGRSSSHGSSSAVAASSGGASGEGSTSAGAVLGDGEGLEHGLGLFGGRVDGEDHALSAVALLSAVEPFGAD